MNNSFLLVKKERINNYMNILRNKMLNPDYIDKLIAFPILLMCVSGISNKEIAEYLVISIEDVVFDCYKYLGFDGWETSLDHNPWFYHKNNLNWDLTKLDKCGIIVDILDKFINIRKELDY